MSAVYFPVRKYARVTLFNSKAVRIPYIAHTVCYGKTKLLVRSIPVFPPLRDQ